MITIYKITNRINNKIYVGKTTNIYRRWKDHKRLAFIEGHKEYNKPLYQAFRKYGLENFDFSIIESVDNNIGEEKEKYWIKYYNSYNNGYNASLGGDGGSIEGHCLGETNGRAILTKEDVILIRTKFAEGISKAECYELVKNKIGWYSFTAVWNGRNWKNIMPEVYTEENIKRNGAIGRATASKNKRLIPKETILDIRKMKEQNIKLCDIIYKYKNDISRSCVADIYYNRTYKDIKIESEVMPNDNEK